MQGYHYSISRMRYTYTPSTPSHTGSKPSVGVGDSGVGKAAVGKNYQLSVKPRLLLGFTDPMRLCHIPKTQAEPAGIYTTHAKPTPNEGRRMVHGGGKWWGFVPSFMNRYFFMGMFLYNIHNSGN